MTSPLQPPPKQISQATNPRDASGIATGTGPLFRPEGPDWRRSVPDRIAHPGMLQQFLDYMMVPSAPVPEPPMTAAEIQAAMAGHAMNATPSAPQMSIVEPPSGSKMLYTKQNLPWSDLGNPVVQRGMY